MLVYGKMLLYLRTTKHLYMNRNNLHTRLWTQAFFRVYLIEYLSFVSVGAGFACPKTFR